MLYIGSAYFCCAPSDEPGYHFSGRMLEVHVFKMAGPRGHNLHSAVTTRWRYKLASRLGRREVQAAAHVAQEFFCRRKWV